MPIHAAVIQKLLSTNAHLGRRTATPQIKPYLFGHRNATAIIDSDKTLISLRTALNFLSHLARTPSARVLFVNTNPLFDPIFDHMSRITGHGSTLSPSAQFWRRSGFLTNPYSPKLFRSRYKRFTITPANPPDCVVVVDVDMKSSVIKEACKVGVPVVALVDTSVPKEVYEKITYPIVCGSSVQFVYMVCNLITKTFLLERPWLRNKNKGAHDVNDAPEDAAVNSSADVVEGVAHDAAAVNASADVVEGVAAEDAAVNASADVVEGVAREDADVKASAGVEDYASEQPKETVADQTAEEMKVAPKTA